MKINILDPKATRLIKDLADMKLIAIEKPAKNSFSAMLKKMRDKAETAPSLEEITKEVEMVRARSNAR